MDKPYLDISEDADGVTRTFSDDINPIELKWHRDDEDRDVVSTEPTDWMIQLDNRLPESLNESVKIKRHEWHRLIKGTGNLTLKIKKH